MLYTLLFDSEELASVAKDKISRAALRLSMRYAFGTEPGEIIYNECGKPRFATGGVEFSVSHSDRLVAITLSDDAREVGVDIEKKRDIRHAEKIEERLLSSLDVPRSVDSEEKIVFLGANGEKREVALTRAKKMDFFERWTLLESLLKCEGGGFRSVGDARELLKSRRVNLYNVEYRGEEYALAVAQG